MIKTMGSFARYLPVDPVQEVWGIHVLDCGYTDIQPHTNYPPTHHPESYTFNWDNGRVLDEYQLVYISKGKGVFESEQGGTHSISAGTAFLLFPGEWHRYSPDSDTGWQENWIGFNGSHAQHIMNNLFSPATPVVRTGADNELFNLLQVVAKALNSPSPGYQEVLAGYAYAIISRLRVSPESPAGTSQPDVQINEAKIYILENSERDIDLQKLSKKLGISYSGFRTKFKKSTGLSPRQFQLQIRINKAQQLLVHTSLQISTIAEDLGFCSLFYFSRVFSAKVGMTPSKFRDARTKNV